MKTPEQIRNMEFQKSTMGGYKQSDVELFLEEVASQVEILIRQKNDAERKLQEVGQKSPDASLAAVGIQNVLISAQMVADQITAEAKNNAESIETEAKLKLTEADLKSKDIISDAERKAVLLGETAEKEAAKIIADSQEKAKIALVAASESVELEQKLYDRLKIEIADFKKKAEAQCSALLTSIDELPSDIPFNLERSKTVLSIDFSDPEELLKKAVEEKLAKDNAAEAERREAEQKAEAEKAAKEVEEPVEKVIEKVADEAPVQNIVIEEEPAENIISEKAEEVVVFSEEPAVSVSAVVEDATEIKPAVTVVNASVKEEPAEEAFQFSFDSIETPDEKKSPIGFFVEDEEEKPAHQSKMHITFDDDDDDDDDEDDEPRLFFRKKKK